MKRLQFPDSLPCIYDLPIPNNFWRFQSCDLTCQEKEQIALLNIYKTTSGQYWTKSRNWGNASVSHCSWYGVVCDTRSRHVIALNLQHNNVTGTWNSSFHKLTHLMGLCLRWSNVNATLERILSTLSRRYLIRLDVSYSRIHGPVPWNSILQYQQLLKLQMAGNNNLRGKLPSNIGQLKKLVILELGQTQITGAIPESFATLTNLWYIDFTSLKLRGNLTIFMSMRKLAYLRLSWNKLNGHIPFAINDALPNVRKLHLQYNELKGIIPESIGYLAHLQYLNLEGNPLTGFVPRTLKYLTKIETFIISRTELTGFAPAAHFGSRHFVHFSAWRSKKFNCSFQRLVQVLQGAKSSLQRINMRDTQLHGRLTSDIFTFKELASFDFRSCKLTGELPEPVINLNEVQRLNKIVLRGNPLRGGIPSSYSKLQNLYVLDLREIGQMHGDLNGLLTLDYKELIKEGPNTTYYQCPSLRFRHNGGHVYTESSYYYRKYCICNEGYYGVGGVCKKCMVGGICPGHILEELHTNYAYIPKTRMVMRADYWPYKSWENVNRLVRCANFSSKRQLCNPNGDCICSAVVNFKDQSVSRTVCEKTCICSVGHKGRFCSQCLDGYFRNGAICVSCPKETNLKEQTAVFTSSVLGQIALLSIAVVLSRKKKKLAMAFAVLNVLSACLLAIYRIIPIYISQINIVILILSFGWLADSCKGLLNIGIFYIQVMDSLVSSINIWPKPAYKLHYYVTGPFNFHFDSLCSYIPRLFTVTAHLTASLAFPAAAIFLIWTVYFLAYIFGLRKRHNTKTSFNLQCRNYSLLILDFCYFPIVKKVFSVLPTCRKIGKVSFMANFVWIDCGSQTHKTLLALAGLAVPIYILGVPYLIFLPLLYKNRHKIKENSNYTDKWLGSLYKLFKPHYRMYAKPLMMTLRLLIAMAMTVIPSNSMFQTISIVMLLLIAIVIETHTKPYKGYLGKVEVEEGRYRERGLKNIGLGNMFEISTLLVMMLTFILTRFYLMTFVRQAKVILIWAIAIMNFALITALIFAILIRSLFVRAERSTEDNNSFILYDDFVSEEMKTE